MKLNIIKNGKNVFRENIKFPIRMLSVFAIFYLLIKLPGYHFTGTKIPDNFSPVDIVLVLIVFMVFLSACIALVQYLVKDQETDYDTLRSKINEFNNRLSSVETVSKSDIVNNDGTIENIIHEKIEAGIQMYFSSKFDSEIEIKYKNAYIREHLDKMLIPLEKHTDKYISTLKKNSSVNLVLGMGITFLSIVILGYTVVYNKSNNDWSEFIIHYGPRISFVIFVQIFAFFFLRLYKTNLEDIKYSQNEATNIICKTTAIRMAQLFNNKEDLSTFLNDLSKTERNFKLLNGETLLTLEKSKLEMQFDLRMTEMMKEFNFLKEKITKDKN